MSVSTRNPPQLTVLDKVDSVPVIGCAHQHLHSRMNKVYRPVLRPTCGYIQSIAFSLLIIYFLTWNRVLISASSFANLPLTYYHGQCILVHLPDPFVHVE